MTLLVGACVVVMTFVVGACGCDGGRCCCWCWLGNSISHAHMRARGHTHASKIVDTGEYARIRVRV